MHDWQVYSMFDGIANTMWNYLSTGKDDYTENFGRLRENC